MLVVAGIVIFGGGKFFKRTVDFVMYFQGSVRGLDVGAPVRLEGVKVGTVTKIDAIFDPASDEITIPVRIQLDLDAVESKTAMREDPEAIKREIKGLIEQTGFRAQLVLQSLVTGKLFVELKFEPETPIKYVEDEGEYFQIPTIPSAVQELRGKIRKIARNLADAPLDKIGESALRLLEGLDKKVNSPEVDETLADLHDAIEGLDKLAHVLSTRADSLITSAEATLEDSRSTLRDASRLMRHVDSKVDPVADDLIATLASARKALATAQGTLQSVGNFIGEKSPLRYNLQTTLEQLAAAARSIRQMADYIERHPDALIYGKRGARGR